VSLAVYYGRQRAWRNWPAIVAALPLAPGQTVLDLGCGVGDQAAELVARGARVIGFDSNEEVLAAARAKGLAGAEFREGDLRAALPDLDVPVDGIWSSFTAAYFPELPAALARWTRPLRPGGWVALTEIDDFFGHGPVGDSTRELLAAYARDALDAGRYDFHMGRKLAGHLEAAGLTVDRTLTVEDQELSFDGPALPAVVAAWRARLDGMRLLHEHCGPRFEEVREDFLACLARPDHHATARVHCSIATRQGR
jgi:SAM-dependent methyltransferase